MAKHENAAYPVQFSVDYPEGTRNRLTALLRIILAVPVFILALLLELVSISLGLIVIPTVLVIMIKKKYPRWWFDHNLEVRRFLSRVNAYVALLRDEYPSTDERQAVHLDIEYPTSGQLVRFMPLIKWLLATPHYVILIVLFVISVIASVAAWVAILTTGRYPEGMFNFVVGVMRWNNRVNAYVLMQATDRYPPFRLGE